MSGKARFSHFDRAKHNATRDLFQLIIDCKDEQRGLALSEMVVGKIMPGIAPDGEIIYGTRLWWTTYAINLYARRLLHVRGDMTAAERYSRFLIKILKDRLAKPVGSDPDVFDDAEPLKEMFDLSKERLVQIGDLVAGNQQARYGLTYDAVQAAIPLETELLTVSCNGEWKAFDGEVFKILKDATEMVNPNAASSKQPVKESASKESASKDSTSKDSTSKDSTSKDSTSKESSKDSSKDLSAETEAAAANKSAKKRAKKLAQKAKKQAAGQNASTSPEASTGQATLLNEKFSSMGISNQPRDANEEEGGV